MVGGNIRLEEVEEAWSVLEASDVPDAGEINSRTSRWTYRGRTLALARDGMGRRHLLIPLEDHEPFRPDTRSAGVQLLDEAWLKGGRLQRYADVVCRKEHLNRHFSVLVTEIIDALQQPGRADQSIHGVLERWRELLAREGGGLPSTEILVGLMAELRVLRELAEFAPAIVEAWVGPDGERHDIVVPSGSIEVKGTTARTGREVEVHGIFQLEPLEAGPLFLAYAAFDQDPGGESLEDAIDALRRLGCPMDAVEKGLRRLGIFPEHRAELADRRFALRDRRNWRVDDAFPRLVRSSFRAGDLPPGIRSIRYVIDLGGPHPAPCSDGEWAQAVASLVAALR